MSNQVYDKGFPVKTRGLKKTVNLSLSPEGKLLKRLPDIEF